MSHVQNIVLKYSFVDYYITWLQVRLLTVGGVSSGVSGSLLSTAKVLFYAESNAFYDSSHEFYLTLVSVLLYYTVD